ncbi:hypothetical protein [Acidisoma cladoniae]|uniref:hypothetical protein n=1 Tax=Acidisoma cladoniae TaxID=3040935 RepID=UPI00254BDF21|nr:hypothetical protein [Acidisoma sp. PAMC 29798]
MKLTPEGQRLPFALVLIDLDSHSDGALMRMCARAMKLSDDGEIARTVGRTAVVMWAREFGAEQEDLRTRIVHTAARTAEGAAMKALYATSDVLVAARPVLHQAAYSALEDMLRMGRRT